MARTPEHDMLTNMLNVTIEINMFDIDIVLYMHVGRRTDRQTGRQADRQTGRQTDRHAGMQTCRHAGMQACRHAGKHIYTCSEYLLTHDNICYIT